MQASQLKELLQCSGKQDCISYKQAEQAYNALLQHNNRLSQAYDGLLRTNKTLLNAYNKLSAENEELKAQLERLA